MKKQKSTPIIVAKAYLSFAGMGYSPIAPGTVGSLATIPLIMALSYLNINIWIFIATLIIVTILTCLITDQVQKLMKLHDPQWIVIDEVLGMLVTWCFIYSQSDIKSLLIAFVAFRVFDITKVWPASIFDKMTHGAGTILDDIISGLYAGIVAYIATNYV